MPEHLPPELCKAITDLQEIVIKEAMILLGMEAEKLGHLMSEDDVDMASSGGYATIAVLMTTLGERGWLRIGKMTRDMLGEER